MTVPLPEYYSALDRGVVDAITTSVYFVNQFGLAELVKYIVGKGFYRTTLTIPMNLERWNRLPKHLQDIMTECMIEFEKEYSDFEAKLRRETLEEIKAKGVEIINLSPDVEKWFVKAAHDGSWEYAQKRFPGDIIPNLRKRITK